MKPLPGRWNDLGIKTKLIILFVIIKIVPLILISLVAIQAVQDVERLFSRDMEVVLEKGEKVLSDTASIAIADSIHALDMKSQTSLERLTVEIANNVAEFLRERDNDILFLSQVEMDRHTLEKFYQVKSKPVTVHEPYQYDKDRRVWKSTLQSQMIAKDPMVADLADNEREFHHVSIANYKKVTRPLYREVTFYNLKGKELLKVSSIDNRLKDISKRKNTYVKAETYYKEAATLKRGEIFVSEVIGAYVPSKVIGTYHHLKTDRLGIKFQPSQEGYAGKENPIGKKFKGIIRFVTPVYKNNRKIGYVTLALDHDHIMEYTDYTIPSDKGFSNISDGSVGNYAFMWDQKGRCISHVRDYFISGFNPETGERLPGWVSEDLYQRYKKSGYKTLNEFLTTVPPFEEQSLKKQGGKDQLREGNVGLDCKYLNHAPQCQGWFQLTEDGGYGSFIILWSGVRKLTTAAAIPYYTGQYGSSARGFGFVTFGANVDEFHAAANKTKENIDGRLAEQTSNMEKIVDHSKSRIVGFIGNTINQLTLSTLFMLLIVILIAVWMSNSITNRITSLTKGAEEFSNNRLDYRIEITSGDEIGQLSKAFNQMALKLNHYQENLEDLIKKRTEELNVTNRELKSEISNHQKTEKKLFKAMKQSEEANQAKTEFLANMSHELRTPMHGILGFAKLGSERGIDLDGKKTIDYFTEIYNSGTGLLELLNDLLDLAKLEAKKTTYDFTVIRISTLISEIVNELKVVINSNRLKMRFLKPNFDDSLELDKSKISRVIRNLLSNAIKFSGKGHDIGIELEDQQTAILISVIDNGIGIPVNELESIFDKFVQSSKSKTGAGGTGLGLSISKQIIEDHRGQIWAEPNPSGGAIFRFSIPKTQNGA